MAVLSAKAALLFLSYFGLLGGGWLVYHAVKSQQRYSQEHQVNTNTRDRTEYNNLKDDAAYGVFRFQLVRCQGKDDTRVSMHGLWPQWAEYCPGEEFDASKLKDIRSRMDRDWFGCHGDSE